MLDDKRIVADNEYSYKERNNTETCVLLGKIYARTYLGSSQNI